MKLTYSKVIAIIFLFTSTLWSQLQNNHVIFTEINSSTIQKNIRSDQLANQVNSIILIKTGESIAVNRNYVTSSAIQYGSYRIDFLQVPTFLHIQIDSVYGTKWSGSFLWNYYTNLTLKAESNATPGNYKPRLVFKFSYVPGGSVTSIDTLTLDVTIYNQPPQKPELISPLNNAVNQHKNIILRWNPVPIAKFYVAQLSNDQLFTSIFKTDTTFSDTTKITGLAAKQQYYWRVQANNSAGVSDWSDTWSFTTSLEWEKTNATINSPVRCFSWNGMDLFAGTDGEGILHSTDEGLNWSPVNTGLTDLSVNALLMKDAFIFAGTNSGIFLSTNKGSSWTKLQSGVSSVTSFAKIGNSLFAGSEGGKGVYLSIDNGKTWTGMNMALGFSPPRIMALTTLGTNLFAGTHTNGVYLSKDFGVSWNKLNNNDIECLITVDSNVFAGCNAYQGIIRSTDGGTNWSPVNNGLPKSNVFTITRSRSNLFIVIGKEVLLSTDYGDNWSSVDLEFTSSGRTELGTSLNYLIAGTASDGIWRRQLIEMIDAIPPAEPQLLSPVSGQMFSCDTLAFNWKNVKNATLYQFQLSFDQSFTSVLKDTTIFDTTVTIDGLSDTSRHNYYWRIEAKNEAGDSKWSDVWDFIITPLSVESLENRPNEFSLSQNYPNPFNSSTTIKFLLPKTLKVTLKIYDTTGREVASLVSKELNSGNHIIQWNASPFASGIYYYQITAGEYIDTKKLVLMK